MSKIYRKYWNWLWHMTTPVKILTFLPVCFDCLFCQLDTNSLVAPRQTHFQSSFCPSRFARPHQPCSLWQPGASTATATTPLKSTTIVKAAQFFTVNHQWVIYNSKIVSLKSDIITITYYQWSPILLICETMLKVNVTIISVVFLAVATLPQLRRHGAI